MVCEIMGEFSDNVLNEELLALGSCWMFDAVVLSNGVNG